MERLVKKMTANKPCRSVAAVSPQQRIRRHDIFSNDLNNLQSGDAPEVSQAMLDSLEVSNPLASPDAAVR